VSAQRGFTLIEVLVALVIVALGMSALLESLGSAADTATWLRDKTVAQWIGFNQLSLTRLAASLPSPGTTAGELDYAGRHWRWRQEVTAMGFPGVYQIDVKVEPALTTTVDESGWVATVTGAVGAAVSPAQLQSLYVDPTQPGGATGSAPTSSQPSSAPTGFFAPPAQSAPQTPAGSQ
jgi:general secretion pathway protein I